MGGLPAIAGPILFVLALDQGTTFAADAANGTLLGVIPVMAFVLAYVVVSKRRPWQAAVPAGWACFLVAVAVLLPVHVDPWISLVLACLATTATIHLVPRPAAPKPLDDVHPRGELWVRALCALVPVALVTGAAHLLGPHLSGLLASFPIMTPVLAAFTQSRYGAAEAARLLHGLATGFYSYALFCFVVCVTLVGLGIAASFALAVVAALAVQAVALVVTGRHERTLVLEV